MHYRCPCGRSSPCGESQSTAPAEPATPTPRETPSPTGRPSLPDATAGDEIPSYGDLVADTGETDDPDEILTEAHTHEWDACYALVSGGYDSVAAAHYTMHNAPFPVDGVIHIDTSIGLRETTEYVEDLADEWGIPLHIADERREEDEFAYRIEDYGFPGATKQCHRFEWIANKDKPLQNLLRQITGDGNTLLISGATREESDARYEKVNSNGIELKDDHLYASPLASWTGSDVKEYIDAEGIPRSEVVDKLNHSADCLCGAYADRTIELEVIDEEWPYLRAYIQSLEARVIDAARNGDMKQPEYEDYVLWAHGSKDRDLPDLDDSTRQKKLCQSCEPALGGVAGQPQTLTEAALKLDGDSLPDSPTLFRDTFDVTQAIPDDTDEHPLDVLKRGYEALDDVAQQLGYDDHKEMVEAKLDEQE